MKKHRRIIRIASVSVMMCVVLFFGAYFLNERYYIFGKEVSGVSVENSDDVAEFIRNCLKKHSWQFSIEFTVHTDDLEIIDGVVEDLMEQALEETEISTEGDYIRFQYGGYEVKYEYSSKIGNQYHYVVKIMPNYYTTPEQEEYVTEKIENILSELKIDDAASDYEKVKKVYDYIYHNVSYDIVHKHKENNHMKATAYSAIKYKTAVCQGYAVLMYRLLKEVGIQNRVITGTVIEEGEEQLHAWNIVKIDERYYNLDVTWNKTLKTEEYFLKSDESFTDHIRSDDYRTDEFYQNYPMAEQDYRIEN